MIPMLPRCQLLHAATLGLAVRCTTDNPEFRHRVLAALGLLVGSKLLNISVPLIMKGAVDAMTLGPAGGWRLENG